MSVAEPISKPVWCPLSGAHYLHAQKTSRAPRRYVFIDTEAWRDKGPSRSANVGALVAQRPSSGAQTALPGRPRWWCVTKAPRPSGRP